MNDCKHEEWAQPLDYVGRNWKCCRCGLTMTAVEMLLWNDINKLRNEIRQFAAQHEEKK